jgi:hypothetical protein
MELMCALCLRQEFLDVEAERPESERWNTPKPAVTMYKGTATCFLHLEDLYAGTPITNNRRPSSVISVTRARLDSYPIEDLLHWLTVAQMRWAGSGKYQVTYRLDGQGLSMYQDGFYRATLVLDQRPMLTDWADDNA